MTSMLINVYIDKLDDMVHKYNSAHDRTIKMKPVDVNPSIFININKEKHKEEPNFKYQNMNIYLQMAIFQLGQKLVFVIPKLKKLFQILFCLFDYQQNTPDKMT